MGSVMKTLQIVNLGRVAVVALGLGLFTSACKSSSNPQEQPMLLPQEHVDERLKELQTVLDQILQQNTVLQTSVSFLIDTNTVELKPAYQNFIDVNGQYGTLITNLGLKMSALEGEERNYVGTWLQATAGISDPGLQMESQKRQGEVNVMLEAMAYAVSRLHNDYTNQAKRVNNITIVFDNDLTSTGIRRTKTATSKLEFESKQLIRRTHGTIALLQLISAELSPLALPKHPKPQLPKPPKPPPMPGPNVPNPFPAPNDGPAVLPLNPNAVPPLQRPDSNAAVPSLLIPETAEQPAVKMPSTKDVMTAPGTKSLTPLQEKAKAAKAKEESRQELMIEMNKAAAEQNRK